MDREKFLEWAAKILYFGLPDSKTAQLQLKKIIANRKTPANEQESVSYISNVHQNALVKIPGNAINPVTHSKLKNHSESWTKFVKEALPEEVTAWLFVEVLQLNNSMVAQSLEISKGTLTRRLSNASRKLAQFVHESSDA